MEARDGRDEQGDDIMQHVSAIGRLTTLLGGLALGASLSLFTIGGPAFAATSHATAPGDGGLARAAEAQALTQALVALNRRYQADGGANLERQLVDLAADRQAVLAELIATAPGEVLKVALPAGLAAAMPEAVQAFLEQRREIDGELQVFHVDHEDPSQSRFVYVLETTFGERFSLHFAADPPGLVSGAAIGVSGLLFEGVDAEDVTETDGAVILDTGDSSIELLARTAAPPTPSVPRHCNCRIPSVNNALSFSS